MSMVRPMPKAILIHEAIYEEYKGSGRYGIEYKEPVLLENVLIQPVSSLQRTGTGDSKAFNSLMFFDCVNSKPLDVKFVKDSKITFEGEEMILNEVNRIYTFSLHHYELELI